MKRPVPPSNFRSSGDTAEDLRRVRQHQQEILDWIDSQISDVEDDIAAIPAGVTSFNARTGAVVPANGDYTATQVGLGNVTNDAQLKRAGSDYTGFTAQTGFAAGDNVLVERASDGAKRKVAASAFDRNWLTALNASPDTWNFDARLASDPDLANNGWTFHMGDSPWTTMTRSGNIDMSSTPGTTNYRSQIVGGTLVLQMQPNDFAVLYKSTASTAKTYKAHAWAVQYGVGASVDTAGTVDLMISDNTHRLATGARTYFHGVNSGNVQEFLLVGPSTFTSFTNTAFKQGGQDVVSLLHNPASGNVMGAEQFTYPSGIQVLDTGFPSTGARTVTMTPTIAGLWLFGNASKNTLICIDFIRRGTYLDRFC